MKVIYIYIYKYIGLYMEYSPSFEANSEEISHILCNPEVDYCIHKRPLLVSTLSQLNALHAFSSHFFNMRF